MQVHVPPVLHAMPFAHDPHEPPQPSSPHVRWAQSGVHASPDAVAASVLAGVIASLPIRGSSCVNVPGVRSAWHAVMTTSAIHARNIRGRVPMRDDRLPP
jgi:hypothetical protein